MVQANVNHGERFISGKKEYLSSHSFYTEQRGRVARISRRAHKAFPEMGLRYPETSGSNPLPATIFYLEDMLPRARIYQ